MRNVDLTRLAPGPDVWELDVLPYPSWILDAKQPAYRPFIAWCMSRTRSWQISMSPSRPGESEEQMALLVLTKALRNGRSRLDRPWCILMRHAVLLEALRDHVEPYGITLELVDELPLVDEGQERVSDLHPDPRPDGYLPDIERPLLEEYAAAAVEFAEAEPWRTVHDCNLIELDPAPEDMRYCVVSGFTGGTRGFCFYFSPEEHARFAADPDSRDEIASIPRWMFSISTGLHVPNADLDLWDDFGLPRIAGRDFPLLELNSGDDDEDEGRPGPERVEFVVALLRGLADIGRRGIDGAPMRKLVRGYGGPMLLSMTVSELVRRT